MDWETALKIFFPHIFGAPTFPQLEIREVRIHYLDSGNVNLRTRFCGGKLNDAE